MDEVCTVFPYGIAQGNIFREDGLCSLYHVFEVFGDSINGRHQIDRRWARFSEHGCCCCKFVNGSTSFGT